MPAPIPRTLHRHLSPKTWDLVEQAHQLMNKSKDPYHDHTHVARMLDDLEQFLLHGTESSKVNPLVMILSVVWHDTWKSHRVAKNMPQFLYHQLLDGIGSVGLFDRSARQVGLEKDVIDRVNYAIRKHAQFQVFPRKTWEAKLLQDLDNLDLWSTKRLELGKNLFVFNSPWKLKTFVKALDQQSPHTEWAKAERLGRQPELYVAVQKLLNNLNGSAV